MISAGLFIGFKTISLLVSKLKVVDLCSGWKWMNWTDRKRVLSRCWRETKGIEIVI